MAAQPNRGSAKTRYKKRAGIVMDYVFERTQSIHDSYFHRETGERASAKRLTEVFANPMRDWITGKEDGKLPNLDYSEPVREKLKELEDALEEEFEEYQTKAQHYDYPRAGNAERTIPPVPFKAYEMPLGLSDNEKIGIEHPNSHAGELVDARVIFIKNFPGQTKAQLARRTVIKGIHDAIDTAWPTTSKPAKSEDVTDVFEDAEPNAEEAKLMGWLQSYRGDAVTVSEAAVDGLGFPPGDRSTLRRVSSILDALGGWQRTDKRRVRHGSNSRVYERTEKPVDDDLF